MTLLQLKDLNFGYNSSSILKDVQLTLSEGEFVTLLGPSGSGKSTLLQLIGGLMKPSSGSISLNGKDITGKKGYISYMPQSPSLLPWRTVLENVVLGAELQGQKNVKVAEKMLEKAGLGAHINDFPSKLSGGMLQRVAFLRALLSPQPILLLDEPFSALDEITRQEMGAWLLSIWENYRKTILFITHSTEEALFLSDRILVLSNKPARVRNEVHVPFARPRDLSITFNEEFIQLKKELVHSLISK